MSPMIVLHVKVDARVEEILAGVSARLGIEFVAPAGHGRTEVWRQASGPYEYADVVAALDATAEDWRDYISILRP